jgi:hypothetical protein
MQHTLADYYRIPAQLLAPFSSENLLEDAGFFRFGSEAICYGRCKTDSLAKSASGPLYDSSGGVHFDASGVIFPFLPRDIIDNLRKERYATSAGSDQKSFLNQSFVRKSYYAVRGWLPDSLRSRFQKIYFRGWQDLPFPHWPVDFTVENLHERFLRVMMQATGAKRIPFVWFWPSDAKSCLIMTHDVETVTGRNFTSQLMDLDQSRGIRASFQVIPEERYEVPDAYVDEIRHHSCEFNIHDLNHDGSLFRHHKEFLRRAAKINKYAAKYGTRGFRAGSMYRNQEWYDAFEFSYDMSVPNVAHLEPQRGGCCTVRPYFVGKILELPLTMAQDYSLFHVLNDYSIDLWKRQIDLIRGKHGLISFNVHPDYVIEARARTVYTKLLDYLRDLIRQERVWAALPGDVDRWWRARSQMTVVPQGNGWVIEGLEKERARVAYAVLENDQLNYEFS